MNWRLYAEHPVAPLRRIFGGAFMPNTEWLHSAEHSHAESDDTESACVGQPALAKMAQRTIQDGQLWFTGASDTVQIEPTIMKSSA
jgi:DeoR/GlpR family transcriptional regulator of sugar metabolism